MASHCLPYSDKVGFVRIPWNGSEDLQVFWPCVVFHDLEALVEAHQDLLQKLEHGPAITRSLQNEIARKKKEPHETPSSLEITSSSNVAYLLGKEMQDGEQTTPRLVFQAPNPDFESQYFDAIADSCGYQGFRAALCEALKLFLGPEFSRKRLRMSEVEDGSRNVMWPCILFDDYESLTHGLTIRGLLAQKSKELDIAKAFIQLMEQDDNLPPFVYYFGNDPNGYLVDVNLTGYKKFDKTIGAAMIDNHGHVDFQKALQEAVTAVAFTTTVDTPNKARPEKRRGATSTTTTTTASRKKLDHGGESKVKAEDMKQRRPTCRKCMNPTCNRPWNHRPCNS